MSLLDTLLESASAATGISKVDLTYVFGKGERKVYAPGEYLFHESSPRLWAGIVEEGEVQVVRGLHGSTTHLSTLAMGAMIGEGALLDETPHSTSAFTRAGATVWIVLRADWEHVKKHDPEIFYRIVARVAQRQAERLRHASDLLAGKAGADTLITAVRREHDLLGDRDVPLWAYYGVQTLRGVENFPISGMPIKNFAHFVNAFAMVKKGAAQANCELGVLAKEKMEAICAACDEIMAGKLHDNFVVDMIQGGAGTSTNMNANEVIANRALEIMGHSKGEYKKLHPNDDVNCSQSTNDAYPTAIKMAVYFALQDTLGALEELKRSLHLKEQEFAQILKMGRTENQDAVPITLGQEFGAYAAMIGSAMKSMRIASDELLEINMGATAIGTGINSPPGYAELVTKKIAAISGLALRKAENMVESTQDSGVFSQMAGNMKRSAVQISKICNDLRWMSSGPRCGLYEIRLPAMQPGSSIMPGKVNPVIPEMVSQVCFTIIGYDVTVAMASEASELELNMAEPIIAYCLLHGLMILKNATLVLTNRCINGIQPNAERCLEMVQNSIGLVTALNPVLGYEKSVSIAKEALETGGSVYELVLQKGWLTKERLDDILKPENMTQPRTL
jgi:aspartate ammonia-lyase